jgi:hypothetical protein
MASARAAPTRVFAEGYDNGRSTPEAKAVAATLASAGVPVECLFTLTKRQFQDTHLKTFARTDLAVGNPEFVRLALQQLGVPIPQPPDYPTCLSKQPLLFKSMFSCHQSFLPSPPSRSASSQALRVQEHAG